MRDKKKPKLIFRQCKRELLFLFYFMSFINLHSPIVSITSTQKWKRGFNVPRALPATGSAQTGDGAAGRNTIKPGLHGHICPYIWRVGYISRYICRVGYMSRYWALARHARDLSDTHVTCQTRT
jgi:hypothetical protein